MAKRIEGVTEKILACAKEEFLANGYENASLRVIAEKAGYTKGVIYIRYPDKESLYRALVEPVADGLCDFLQFALNGFQSLSGEEQKANEETMPMVAFLASSSIFTSTSISLRYC